METKDKIVEALKEVYDPEIPINVYDLGLIYEITPKEDGNVHILMTFTSPACPTGDYLKTIVREAAESVAGVKEVEVEVTFEPAWTPERVSIGAREELGFVETPKTQDLAMQNVFTPGKESVSESLCFNCGASHRDVPLLESFYKGEKVKICVKCLHKFG